MRTTALISSVITLVAACGGGDAQQLLPDAAPDPEPDADTRPATAIVVDTEVAPVLIALREGAGPWQPIPIVGGVYNLEVHGPYSVTVVCDFGLGGADTYQVSRTPDDERDLFLPCLFDDSGNVTVTGKMVQPGRVSIGFGSQSSTTPNWDFELSALEATTDLVAATADRFAIRRDLDATVPITPPIDVATEGTALIAAPLSATNAIDGESVDASITLRTASLTFGRIYRGPVGAALIAPDAALAATDRQRVSVTASAGGNTRSVFRGRFREGDPTTFELPAAITGPTFTGGATPSVAWTSLPEHEFVDATLFAATEDFSKTWFHDVEISAAYLTATGASRADFDTAIDGFLPEWRPDAGLSYDLAVSAFHFADTESRTSTATETVTP